MLDTLKTKLAAQLEKLLPPRAQRVIVYDPRQETTGLSQTINVDRALALFREADAGNPTDLFALYTEILLTDSHLQTELGKRKLAVLGDPLAILPVDKKNADDVKAAEAVRAMIEDYEPHHEVGEVDGANPREAEGASEDFDYAAAALLDAVLWPVVVMEKIFRPASEPGLRYELSELVPVPAWLLDFSEGRMRIKATDPKTGAPTGELMEVDRRRFIVHRGHMLSAADFRGGPMRSLVLWWMLSQLSREWWARFLDRYGSPFLVGKYDQADDASRSVLERAFQWAVKIGGLVVSKQTEVEIQQAGAGAHGDAYEKFIAICQREKSKLILGQTLSTESQPLGIGGGASKTHEGVRQDFRQFDAHRLGKTLTRQLFRQYLEINGFKGRPPRAVFGGESPEDAVATGELLGKLKQAGIRVADSALEQLGERVGLALERDQAPAPAEQPPALALGARLKLLSAAPLLAADDANGQIAATGAADLARAFRGALAPVRQMVLDASSPDELQDKILSAYADWPVGRVAAVIEAALTAFALNAYLR